MNIELFISNKLCDLGNSDLSIILKRQFLNPVELNTKDAQKSYEFELPATSRNNNIFGFKNIEEVQDKFSTLYDAQLYIGGVLILDGKFMFSRITRDGYKGNLGVPKRQEAKDIFEHTVMSEAGEWLVENFKGLESVSEHNLKDSPPVIFPLVLYGLLPKEGRAGGGYTGKDIFDHYVRLGLGDFLPSVNCIQMLKHIFYKRGYNLSGTALADERLNSLYVSYKNPNDYQFDWGAHDIHLTGDWKHYGDNPASRFDYSYISNKERSQFNVNIFKATNHNYSILGNNGGSISEMGRQNRKVSVSIPYSGLYKVELNLSCRYRRYNIYQWGGNRSRQRKYRYRAYGNSFSEKPR